MLPSAAAAAAAAADAEALPRRWRELAELEVGRS